MIIALEGLPGAGKTTTAQLLAAKLGAPSVTESTRDHPFLQAVYRDANRHDLEIELAFLLLHAGAWRALGPETITITDFTPVKDLLFARDTLRESADLKLFESAYDRLNDGSTAADIAVYLDATPELALERVRLRYESDPHRRFEGAMEAGRLRAIERQYQVHHDQLGALVLDLDLGDVLDDADTDEASKRRVADSVLALLGEHTGDLLS